MAQTNNTLLSFPIHPAPQQQNSSPFSAHPENASIAFCAGTPNISNDVHSCHKSQETPTQEEITSHLDVCLGVPPASLPQLDPYAILVVQVLAAHSLHDGHEGQTNTTNTLHPQHDPLTEFLFRAELAYWAYCDAAGLASGNMLHNGSPVHPPPGGALSLSHFLDVVAMACPRTLSRLCGAATLDGSELQRCLQRRKRQTALCGMFVLDRSLLRVGLARHGATQWVVPITAQHHRLQEGQQECASRAVHEWIGIDAQVYMLPDTAQCAYVDRGGATRRVCMAFACGIPDDALDGSRASWHSLPALIQLLQHGSPTDVAPYASVVPFATSLASWVAQRLTPQACQVAAPHSVQRKVIESAESATQSGRSSPSTTFVSVDPPASLTSQAENPRLRSSFLVTRPHTPRSVLFADTAQVRSYQVGDPPSFVRGGLRVVRDAFRVSQLRGRALFDARLCSNLAEEEADADLSEGCDFVNAMGEGEHISSTRKNIIDTKTNSQGSSRVGMKAVSQRQPPLAIIRGKQLELRGLVDLRNVSFDAEVALLP